MAPITRAVSWHGHSAGDSSAFQHFRSPGRAARSVWKAYCTALASHALATQAATAAVGFSLGDASAQIVSEGRTRPRALCRDRGGRLRRLLGRGRRREPPPEPFRYDWRRTARLATFGAAVAGPMGHGWFTLLDRYVLPSAPRSIPAVALKMVVDQALMAPFGCALFYGVQGVLSGAPATVLPTLREKFAPTLAASYKLWPAAHIVNFGLVPPSYRVLYTNLVSVLWTFILSKTAASGGGEPVMAIASAGLEGVPLCIEEGNTDAEAMGRLAATASVGKALQQDAGERAGAHHPLGPLLQHHWGVHF